MHQTVIMFLKMKADNIHLVTDMAQIRSLIEEPFMKKYKKTLTSTYLFESLEMLTKKIL